MNSPNRKRPTLKMWVRVSLTIIISLGIFIPILEIYLNSIEKKQYNNKKIYSYQINQSADYKVQLFDNTFTDEQEMESNKIYIADLTKNINLNLGYTYSGTKKSPLKYTYEITGKLYGENQDSQNGKTNTVWEKKYQLLEKTEKEVKNTSGFAVTENLDIDYQKYQNEVANFKKRFGMTLNTKLKVIMNIKVNGKYEKNNIDRNDNIILEIPLGNQAFSITEDYEKTKSKDYYEKKQNIKIVNSAYTKLCISISLISILLFILSFKALFNIKPKSSYTKKINKILKNYGQIIVEVENPIKEKSFNIVKVKDFNEMLDLEEELKLPIIFYEDLYNYKAVFTITKESTIYKCIIKNQ